MVLDREVHEGSHMIKSAVVALVVLASCDFVAFGGQYTADVLRVLSAIEHAFV